MNETDRMNAASAKLARYATGELPPIGYRISAEIEYGEAYAEMARAGTRIRLRAKYRRGNSG